MDTPEGTGKFRRLSLKCHIRRVPLNVSVLGLNVLRLMCPRFHIIMIYESCSIYHPEGIAKQLNSP